MKRISRRSALRAIALSSTLAYNKKALAKEKGTAFALIGDRYHNSDYIRVSLGKTLGSGLDLSIDFCDEVKLLNAEELQGYRVLIILRDGMTWPDGYPVGGQGRSGSGEIVSEPVVRKNSLRCGINNLECTRDNVTLVRLACCASGISPRNVR